LQHTATHCNTLQHTRNTIIRKRIIELAFSKFNTTKHSQKSARYSIVRTRCFCFGSVLQCIVVCCSVLQCVAVCCSVLQCAAVQSQKSTLKLKKCQLATQCGTHNDSVADFVNIHMKRDLYTSKETYTYEKRPIHMQRDLYT